LTNLFIQHSNNEGTLNHLCCHHKFKNPTEI